MSTFVTRNGVTVECTEPHCICNTPTAHPTEAAVDAWFDPVCDAVEEYLLAYVAWRDAPKADQDHLNAARLEAKARVISAWETGR